MDISIIIPVGRPEWIADAVASLRAQDFAGSWEILLIGEVEQLSLDGEAGAPPIRCIPATTPLLRSAAARRNRGAALAQGRLLAFLDDDAAAPRDWLQQAWDHFETDPLLQILGGPNILFPDVSTAERLSDALLTTPVVGAGSSAYGESDDARSAHARLAGIGEIHLVNCVVRADLLRLMGGFNEGLGYGGEDSEFVYLTRRLYGARAVFDPALSVHHHRRPFGMAYLRQRFQLRRNSGRLLWVHPRMYLSHPIMLALMAGIFLGGIAFVAAALTGQFTILLVGVGILVVVYLVLVGMLAVTHGRRRGVALWRFAPALIAHHVVNVAGLGIGVASILWMRGYSDLRRGTLWARVGLGGEPMLTNFIEEARG